jgi:hypothetical protein
MKTCIKCNIDKELNHFYKDKSRTDGYTYVCKICIKSQSQFYYNNHTEEHKNRNTQWQLDNKKSQQFLSQKSYNSLKNDKEWIKNRYNYNNQYQKLKYNTSIQFKITRILRNRFRAALKGNIKTQTALNLLGCDVNMLKIYLENQFKPEMSWDNYGEVWEIDHILPCSKFNLNLLEEQRKCFHFLNLQPLFKTTEISEGFGYTNEIGNRNKLNKI